MWEKCTPSTRDTSAALPLAEIVIRLGTVASMVSPDAVSQARTASWSCCVGR